MYIVIYVNRSNSRYLYFIVVKYGELLKRFKVKMLDFRVMQKIGWRVMHEYLDAQILA